MLRKSLVPVWISDLEEPLGKCRYMAIAMVPIVHVSPISGSERTALTTCGMQMSISLDVQGVREVDFDWKKSSGGSSPETMRR